MMTAATCAMHVVATPLHLLQLLLNVLVGLSDMSGFVALDHALLQPVLQCPQRLRLC